MSFTVILRKFNKRENSTKVPDGNEDNITLACNLKQSSGVISPVLSFKTIRRGFSSSRGVGFESINYFTIFIIT